jgi:hypothetical protein
MKTRVMRLLQRGLPMKFYLDRPPARGMRIAVGCSAVLAGVARGGYAYMSPPMILRKVPGKVPAGGRCDTGCDTGCTPRSHRSTPVHEGRQARKCSIAGRALAGASTQDVSRGGTSAGARRRAGPSGAKQ